MPCRVPPRSRQRPLHMSDRVIQTYGTSQASNDGMIPPCRVGTLLPPQYWEGAQTLERLPSWQVNRVQGADEARSVRTHGRLRPRKFIHWRYRRLTQVDRRGVHCYPFGTHSLDSRGEHQDSRRQHHFCDIHSFLSQVDPETELVRAVNAGMSTRCTGQQVFR